MAGSTLDSVVKHLFIAPEAHVRIGDVDLQSRLYDAFHTTWLSRWAHVVGTPAMLLAVVLLLARVPLGPVDLALPVVAALCLWYCRVDLIAGGICTVLGLTAWAAFALWAPPLWLALVIAATVGGLGLTVQTFSHLTEPVPPPWSPVDTPCTLGTFLAQPDKARVVLGVIVMTGMGILLESWAAPRIPPYQVLFVLSRLGWRRRASMALETH